MDHYWEVHARVSPRCSTKILIEYEDADPADEDFISKIQGNAIYTLMDMTERGEKIDWTCKKRISKRDIAMDLEVDEINDVWK